MPLEINYFEASKLPVGTRVRFVRDYEQSHQFPIVKAGSEGVIVDNSLNEMHPCMFIRMDDETLREACKAYGDDTLQLTDQGLGEVVNSSNPDEPAGVWLEGSHIAVIGEPSMYAEGDDEAERGEISWFGARSLRPGDRVRLTRPYGFIAHGLPCPERGMLGSVVATVLTDAGLAIYILPDSWELRKAFADHYGDGWELDPKSQCVEITSPDEFGDAFDDEGNARAEWKAGAYLARITGEAPAEPTTDGHDDLTAEARRMARADAGLYPTRFAFPDGDDVYEGWVDGSGWSAGQNVWVEPALRDQFAKVMDEEKLLDQAAELRAFEPDPATGLIFLDGWPVYEVLPTAEAAREARKAAKLRPVFWGWDDQARQYEGFTDGSVWNGFANIWLTPSVRARVARELADDPAARAELASLPIDPNTGLVSMANRYTPVITAFMAPEPEPVPARAYPYQPLAGKRTLITATAYNAAGHTSSWSQFVPERGDPEETLTDTKRTALKLFERSGALNPLPVLIHIATVPVPEVPHLTVITSHQESADDAVVKSEVI